MQPKISILLPFFNSADTISDAIESTLCQTHSEFELILLDVNSTDDSSSIANDYALRDDRIIILNDIGHNLADALNSGIKAANAPYIALMNALDISYPERLEKQFIYLENNPDVGLVSTQIKYTAETEVPEELERLNQYISWINRIITHEDIFVNRFIETPYEFSTSMFRIDLIDKFGGFLKGDFPVSFEFSLRMLEKGVKMYKIPEVLYDWSYSPARFNYVEDRFFDQGLFECKSRFLNEWLKQNNPYYPDVAVWGAGRSSRQKFNLLHELGVNAKFYIDLRANPEHKVIQYQHTPTAGRNFIISYVSNRAAREKIRIFLVELGYIEGKDFLCIA